VQSNDALLKRISLNPSCPAAYKAEREVIRVDNEEVGEQAGVGTLRAAKEQGRQAGHNHDANGAQRAPGMEARMSRNEGRARFPCPVWARSLLKDGFGPLQVAAGVATATGEAKYGLHALRHAAAAMFIQQGFGPKNVQALMGHPSIRLTFDTYGYLVKTEEEDRAGMAQMEARLLG
jgi:hypothetical protein